MDGPAGPSGPQCSIFPRQVSAWTFSAAIALNAAVQRVTALRTDLH
jgi:hypothetical protein